MMNAIVITQPGAANVLKLKLVQKPIIDEKSVLVKVKAAGVNRLDISQRMGSYPVPEGVSRDILGLEVAGIIESVGTCVKKWQIGDEVFALISGGGYAEYAVVHEDVCIRKPQTLTFVEAASLPEALYTVWSNVFERGALKKGERFLVHGGSSSIGVTAIQLAKIFGAVIYTTVGNDEKKAFCEQLGTTRAINYRQEDYATVLASQPIDVILDMIGGDYFKDNIQLLNYEGRLIYINAMKSSYVELDIRTVMQKRISITGSTLRGRETTYKAHLTKEIEDKVLPLIESGQFKPVVYKSFPLALASKAHELMERSEHIGKIILEIG